MLEVLLAQYFDQFGQEFPLKEFAGKSEIELINVIYACVESNEPYDESRDYGKENRFPTAPRRK